MSTLTYIDQPVPLDLPKIVQGTDWQWSFELNNPDGSAVDTTGMTFACMMRESKTSPAATFVPTTSVSSNTITLSIANAVTAAVMQAKRLLYDIVQTDSLGKKLPLFEGSVQFETAVTR